MNIEEQARYQDIIYRDFDGMKNMLDVIRDRIAQYPVYTQLEFIKPLQRIIIEAFGDATNPNDSFLNNYDGGDQVHI